MKKFYTLIVFACFSLLSNLHASSIILHAKNATVWLPQQTINGEVTGLNVRSVIIHFDDSAFAVKTDRQNKFFISVLLKQKINLIWAEVITTQEHIISDTIQFELGYMPLPLAEPFATLHTNKILLRASVKTNPYDLSLSFVWTGAEGNPAPVQIMNSHNSTASLILPLKKGDYYFNLAVIAGKDTVHFQTLVTRTDSIHCFNLEKDHAAWIDSAIIYEITPSIFVKNGQYNDITAKLPELKQLGINTIWLQPLCKTHAGGQGYDVTDYFSLRADLGSEAQLQYLITTAKNLDMKVLFDFVPNHTSVFHPYAENAALFNTDSHYYNFYQHEDDGAMYSSLYHRDELGFYHYFWPKLVNLNYQNPEVQQWMIEACKYWLKKFDIDGYRFDAVWALNARNPAFEKKLQLELKSIKPDILLLAEDKGANKAVYRQGYDAAYDWEKDTSWISHWSWQTDYDPQHNPTIFNFPNENKRGNMLRDALFSNGDTTHLRLRFMENNDQPRFIRDHGLGRTKMAAALLFALPGIPMLYNGQETGIANKLYSGKEIFNANESIQSQDTLHLFLYYQQLTALRKQYASLRSLHMRDLATDPPGPVVALHRWQNDEQFVVIINMSETAQKVSVDISDINKRKSRKLFFTDVLSNESFSTSLNTLKITMNGFSTKLLLLNDSIPIAAGGSFK